MLEAQNVEQNLTNGRAITPVYVAPQRDLIDGVVDHAQLWSISRAHSKDCDTRYKIRSLVTGRSLEIPQQRASGAQVRLWALHEGLHQNWEFFGSRRLEKCVNPSFYQDVRTESSTHQLDLELTSAGSETVVQGPSWTIAAQRPTAVNFCTA